MVQVYEAEDEYMHKSLKLCSGAEYGGRLNAWKAIARHIQWCLQYRTTAVRVHLLFVTKFPQLPHFITAFKGVLQRSMLAWVKKLDTSLHCLI